MKEPCSIFFYIYIYPNLVIIVDETIKIMPAQAEKTGKSNMRKHSFLRMVLSVGVCKLTRMLLHFLHRGGTALPGKMAMLIDKDILEVVSRGVKVLVVTGTNGKTTTTHMISHALSTNGIRHLTNYTGANLLSGITAEFCCSASLTGKAKVDYAVIECDEGVLAQVTGLIRPFAIVVTNLFRDQLDRYGEVERVLSALIRGIEKVPQAMLCLNADCALISSLALSTGNPVLYYGLNTPSEEYRHSEFSDTVSCIRCKAAYKYRYHTYAHLGDFYCPDCGYSRPAADVGVERIMEADQRGSFVSVRIENEELNVRIPLPTIVNIYNTCAAICGCLAFSRQMNNEQPSPKQFCASFSSVEPSFGRMEIFDLNGVFLQIILVKNPVGCDQVISYLTRLNKDYLLAVSLNDRLADGRDISWIREANYEWLADDPHLNCVYVLGDRAEDMRLRLKEAGFAEEKLIRLDNYNALLLRLQEKRLPMYALPNYTAMLSLRNVVRRKTGKNHFWEGTSHSS